MRAHTTPIHDTTPKHRRGRRRRVVPLLGLILAATAAVSACSGSAPADTLDASAPIPTEIPEGTKLVIADQQEAVQTALAASGELDRLPFEFEFANFIGGPAILEAFRAEAADVAIVGDTPPIHAQVSGEDVPIILSRQLSQDTNWWVTSPNSSITTIEDLRGQRIAYAEGTAQQPVVLRTLELAGSTVDDVEFVRLQSAEVSDALAANQVDAAPLGEPRLTRYLNDWEAEGASVIDPATIDGTISQGLSYIYARRGAIEDAGKAAALRAYLAAYIRAQHWINENQDEWIEAYYVESQGVSAEDGRRILDSIGPMSFPRLDDTLVARHQEIIDVLDRAGELPVSVRAEDGFDRRFDEVIEETVAEVGATHERQE